MVQHTSKNNTGGSTLQAIGPTKFASEWAQRFPPSMGGITGSGSHIAHVKPGNPGSMRC